MTQDQTTPADRLDEAALRRPDFRPGVAVTLADGQDWTLPCPDVVIVPEFDAAGKMGIAYQSDLGAEFDRHLNDLDRAQSDIEEAGTLIKLGVCLVRLNYDLAPAEYSRLLRCRLQPGTPHPMLLAIYRVATGRGRALAASA